MDPGHIVILSWWLATDAAGAVTSVNCLNNPLGEGLHIIIKVFEETPRLRTLCGFEEGVEQIDWSKSGKGPVDVALLAADLNAGRAIGAVTSINCLHNPLGEAVHIIIKVFEETPRLRTLCGLEEGVEQIDWSKSGKGPVEVAR